MNSLLVMTNAVKALIINLVNAIMGLLLVFGVSLSDAQQGAIVLVVNTVLALWIALTYQYSHKRVDNSTDV
jgi:nicotinamide riboside transporter PnuC